MHRCHPEQRRLSASRGSHPWPRRMEVANIEQIIIY
jgi:hypothetical protein